MKTPTFKVPLIFLTAAIVSALVMPAAAFECTNGGAAGTAPNDNDDPEATACGPGAVANGEATTAIGADALASGTLSLAIGVGSEASTFRDIAIGPSAIADAGLGTALGFAAKALAQRSVALGYSAEVRSSEGIAIGTFALASGSNSIMIGASSEATGRESVGLGFIIESTGTRSTAVGPRSTASGNFSSALGLSATASGDNGAALGSLSLASGAGSTAIGHLAIADQPNTIVLGQIEGLNSAQGYADVAIGTTTPLAPLHVFRADDTLEFLFLESNIPDRIKDRPMMQLVNNGGIRFQFDNEVLGTQWRFQAATGGEDNFEVTKVGTGEIEFRVDADGNAFLAGMLFENSDRNSKQNIENLNPQDVLERLASLPISEWEYKDTPGQRHIGPMAQDFHQAFGLGANNTSIATVDTSGVALLSVKALLDRNAALEQRVAELERLQEKVEALEALISANLNSAEIVSR